MSAGLDAEEVAALAHAARLFSDLLLHELDATRLASLQAPELCAALAQLGIDVPPSDPSTAAGRAALDGLAAAFDAALLSPTCGAPPLASRWHAGRDDGEVAARLSDLAALADCDLDALAPGSAPPDHVGCVLLLWAEAAERAPAIADVVALEHLAWAERPLARIAAGEGFYAAVAAAALELVATLATTRLVAPDPE